MITIEPTYIPPTTTNFPSVKLMLAARNGATAGGVTAWTDPERSISLTPSANVVTNDGQYVEFANATTFTVSAGAMPNLTGKYPIILATKKHR